MICSYFMHSYSFIISPPSPSPKVQSSVKREKKKKKKYEEVAGRISRLELALSAKYMGIGSRGE